MGIWPDGGPVTAAESLGAGRSFSLADQVAFASLSGDSNPIHVDPVAARRLLFGAVIVHGLHAVLWALDRAFPEGPARLAELNVKFRQPIRVDSPAAFVVRERAAGLLRLAVSGDGRPAADVLCRYDPAEPRAPRVGWPRPSPGPCRDVAFPEASTAAGEVRLSYDPDAMARNFPRLAAGCPDWQLALLLACDRLLGMECPGRHSLYLGFALRFRDTDTPGEALAYRVVKSDPRYHSLRFAVEAPGFDGHLDTSYRPSPVAQPGLAEIAPLVDPGEFRPERALVVGGSRGLGEVSAKLLAAGGAEVALTYHVGSEDAARVVAEIRAGGGSARAFAYDVLSPGEALGAGLGPDWIPTLLGYFSTPFISLAETTAFSRELFRCYCRHYVEGFLDVFEPLAARAPGLKVLAPSTSALDEVLPKAAEYASAKAAAEMLLAHLAKLHPRMALAAPRLPRMLTDRTASLWPVESADAPRVLLAEWRRLVAAGAAGSRLPRP